MLDEHSSAPDKKYKMVTKVDIPGHGAHMAVLFLRMALTGQN